MPDRVRIAFHDERGELLAESTEIAVDCRVKVAIPLDASYMRVWQEPADA